MKVNYNSKSSVETIEMNLLMKIPEKSLEKMTPDQLKTVAEELQTGYSNPTPELLTMAIRAGIKTSGFAAYQMALVVTNGVAKALLGRGLTVAGNAMLTRTMGALPVRGLGAQFSLATDRFSRSRIPGDATILHFYCLHAPEASLFT